MMRQEFRATTVLTVRRGGDVAMGGDGQVTIGDTVMKSKASKIRKLFKGNVIVGFAGSAADALTLFDKFEGKLEQYKGNLRRAAVELAKDWRTDRILRRLEALLAAVDRDSSLLVSGNGEIIEPDDGIIAIGSGGPYALAAARALLEHTDISVRDIVEKSMKIASEICIYTNDQILIEDFQENPNE